MKNEQHQQQQQPNDIQPKKAKSKQRKNERKQVKNATIQQWKAAWKTHANL